MEKEIQLNDMRVGSTIYVKGTWGKETAIKAEVSHISDDIKNDRPGIQYIECITGEEYWAYLSQVVEVVNY